MNLGFSLSQTFRTNSKQTLKVLRDAGSLGQAALCWASGLAQEVLVKSPAWEMRGARTWNYRMFFCQPIISIVCCASVFVGPLSLFIKDDLII